MDSNFKFLPQFNDPELRKHTGSSQRLCPLSLDYFQGDSLVSKLGRELCLVDTILVKEFFESVEFFKRVRKVVRARVLADLCCGHGLTGLLFALFEKRVESVILVDRLKPPNHEKLFEAMAKVGPWIRDKVSYSESSLSQCREFLTPQTSIVAIHACGFRTDQCLDIAMSLRGATAVMPCCYSKRRYEGSPALFHGLGLEKASDVHRTLLLEREGYRVHWESIPEEITRMRRILIGTPPKRPPSPRVSP